MTKIITSIMIDTTLERAFDLSRSIDFHAYSQKHRNETAIGGRTSGLINLGETVTWRATHLGISQKLSVQITKFERPFSFRDSMIQGAFKRFDHDHIFEKVNGLIRLTDIFDYDAPYLFFGKVFDKLVLEKYMTRFSIERNQTIKTTLESDEWKKFLEN